MLTLDVWCDLRLYYAKKDIEIKIPLRSVPKVIPKTQIYHVST